MNKTPKIEQFQFYNGVLYILDSEGTLWKNGNPSNALDWKSLPPPTIAQHEKEDRETYERIRLDDVEKLNIKFPVRNHNGKDT